MPAYAISLPIWRAKTPEPIMLPRREFLTSLLPLALVPAVKARAAEN